MPAMSKKDREERFEAIAALLRKAEGASTPAEAEAFTDGAMRLAKKYEIDLTMAREAALDRNAALRVTDHRKRAMVESMDKYEPPLKRPKMQQAVLAGVAFRYAGCYILRFGTGNTLRIVAFGYESDLEEGKLLWESLSRQAYLTCSVRYQEHKADRAMRMRGAEVERTFRRGFWDEFARTVNQRLQRIGAEVVAVSEPGTALAIQSKEDRVKAWVETMFGETKSARRRRGSKSMAGYVAGREEGQRADLGFKQVER
jgi:hypothetical protein